MTVQQSHFNPWSPACLLGLFQETNLNLFCFSPLFGLRLGLSSEGVMVQVESKSRNL